MMTVSAGMTVEEIRELVHEFHLQPYGGRMAWLAARGIKYDRFRRWRAAVYGGDLDRGLVPRHPGSMTIPPGGRSALERARAAERAGHEAEVARLNARVRELEQANEALGKAIGLLHAMNEQEPAERPTPTDPSDS